MEKFSLDAHRSFSLSWQVGPNFGTKENPFQLQLLFFIWPRPLGGKTRNATCDVSEGLPYI